MDTDTVQNPLVQVVVEAQQDAAPPPPPAATSDWVKMHDDDHGHHFYHNTVTKETTWEVPAGYVEPAGVTTDLLDITTASDDI